MRYKADYKPQYVLDPLTSGWYPLDQTYWDAINLGKLVTYDKGEDKWQVRESALRRDSEGSIRTPSGVLSSSASLQPWT